MCICAHGRVIVYVCTCKLLTVASKPHNPTPHSLTPLNGGQPLEDSWNQAEGMSVQLGQPAHRVVQCYQALAPLPSC